MAFFSSAALGLLSASFIIDCDVFALASSSKPRVYKCIMFPILKLKIQSSAP